jgi:molybdenum cofactor cytidylyltransferase
VSAEQRLAPGVCGAILAAGGGSRFPGPHHKLLVSWQGKPLVWWAASHALAAGFEQVAVVQGAVDLSAAGLPEGVVVLHNPAWSAGIATSLQTAARWATDRGAEALVIGLGDQPLVSPTTWRAVAGHPAPIAFAESQGQRCPPVRLHRSVFPLLPGDGDEGARVVAKEHPELVGTVRSEDVLVDVDRPEDLARLETLASRSAST